MIDPITDVSSIRVRYVVRFGGIKLGPRPELPDPSFIQSCEDRTDGLNADRETGLNLHLAASDMPHILRVDWRSVGARECSGRVR